MNANRTAPDLLHHYTSVNGLRSILDSRKIRATRYDQMNDTSELRIGQQSLLRAVREYEVADALREYKEFLVSGIEGFGDEPLDVYVLSLSEDGDSLDQWRAYAPQGGVAIGFDFQQLQRGFLCDITRRAGGCDVKNPIRPDPAIQLIRCKYTDRNGSIDLRPLVEERFFREDSYCALYTRQEPLARHLFLAALSVAIYQTICGIKHGAYAQEQEWRCVCFRRDPSDYPIRLSESNRWYIELPFAPKDYVREVHISPHGDQEACERIVRYFMQRDGLGISIHKSSIPFHG